MASCLADHDTRHARGLGDLYHSLGTSLGERPIEVGFECNHYVRLRVKHLLIPDMSGGFPECVPVCIVCFMTITIDRCAVTVGDVVGSSGATFDDRDLFG